MISLNLISYGNLFLQAKPLNALAISWMRSREVVGRNHGNWRTGTHIREWDRQARILVFTMHLSAAFALKAFEAGAIGYITKTSEPGELVKAVVAAANGRRFLSEDAARALAADRLPGAANPAGELGPRETEILRLLAFGMDSETIARLLNLSHKTVRNHHYAIKAKIGARNDAHLVWRALESGLVDAGGPATAEEYG